MRAAATVILLGYLACLIADYPGHFPYDAVWQLAQGREGVYNDWHPPVMAWLLGVADRLLPGAWLFVAAEGALFYGTLFAFVSLEARPRLACLPVLLLWMISPLTLIYQGVALKDVLFADGALAGFAALAWAERRRSKPKARIILLFAALAFFTLATLARQNGFVVAGVGALAFAAMEFQGGSRRDTRRAGLVRSLAHGAAGLGCVALMSVAATHAFAVYGDHDPQTEHHAVILQVYDLAGAVHRDGSVDLTPIRDRRPPLEVFLRTAAAPRYSSAGVDNITTMRGADEIINSRNNGAGTAWGRMIAHKPALYLSLRAGVWWNTLMTPRKSGCPMILTGVDRPEDGVLRRSGLQRRENDKDDWDGDYAAAFLGTPVFSHAAYLAIILVILAIRVRAWRAGERDSGAVACIGLCLAALAFVASFFVISIDCDYRFLYFLDAAAMAALAWESAHRGEASAAPDRKGIV